MKKHIFYLTSLFVFATLIQAQVAVKYNGYRQLESTIAIHPTNSNILATAVMEFQGCHGRTVTERESNQSININQISNTRRWNGNFEGLRHTRCRSYDVG